MVAWLDQPRDCCGLAGAPQGPSAPTGGSLAVRRLGVGRQEVTLGRIHCAAKPHAVQSEDIRPRFVQRNVAQSAVQSKTKATR